MTKPHPATLFYRDSYHLQHEVFPHNHPIYDLIMERSPASVFEFGCNAGRHLVELRERGVQTLGGCDINPRAVQYAQETHNLDVHLTSQPWGLWDVVLTHSVLCHIEDITPVLSELKARGRRIISVETADRDEQEGNAWWWPHDYEALGFKPRSSFYAPQSVARYTVWEMVTGR